MISTAAFSIPPQHSINDDSMHHGAASGREVLIHTDPGLVDDRLPHQLNLNLQAVLGGLVGRLLLCTPLGLWQSAPVSLQAQAFPSLPMAKKMSLLLDVERGWCGKRNKQGP